MIIKLMESEYEIDIFKSQWDQLIFERDTYKAERDQLMGMLDKQKTWVPNGHFYSPIPSLEEIKSTIRMRFFYIA